MKTIWIFNIFLLFFINFSFFTFADKTSYQKINKAEQNYDLMFFAQSKLTTYGVVVYNNKTNLEEVYAWGNNQYGLLITDDESVTHYNSPVNITDNFGDILYEPGSHVEYYAFTGSTGSLVVEDGDGFDHVFTWGSNLLFLLGDGPYPLSSFAPIEITANFDDYLLEGGEVISFDPGTRNYMVGIEDIYGNDHLFIWGSSEFDGNYGEFYDNSTFTFPEEINNIFLDSNGQAYLNNGGKLKSTSFFWMTAAIVIEDNENNDHVFTWGLNNYYQCGGKEVGNAPDDGIQATPIEITENFTEEYNTGYHIESITTSLNYTIAILTNGNDQHIYGWGRDIDETLGSGNNQHLVLESPTNLSNFYENTYNYSRFLIMKMDLSYYNSMILLKDKTTEEEKIVMAGNNFKGQMAYDPEEFDETNYFIDISDKIPNLSNGGKVIDMWNINHTTFAIIKDDQNNTHLYSWGQNLVGSLGIGVEESDMQLTYQPQEVIFE